MCKFKVGDKVRCLNNTFQVGVLHVGKVYTVVYIDGPCVVLEGVGSNSDYILSSNRFELVEKAPTLEEQLEKEEAIYKNLSNKVAVMNVQKMELMERLANHQERRQEVRDEMDRLKAAIKERDKPKGMVKIGDKIPRVTWLIYANGDVREHIRNSFNSASYVEMGNLFYDKASAKQAVHDRKIEVKLKQGK